MECLVLIFGLITLILLFSIFSNLNHIRKETKSIMSNQAEFNAKIEAVNAAITSLGSSIAAEGQQVRDFIAALPPEVDTSALDGVAERLTTLADGVAAIFVAPAEPTEDVPADEADGETPTGDGA